MAEGTCRFTGLNRLALLLLPLLLLVVMPKPLQALVTDQAILARKVLDRLSVLTLMAGEMDRSISVQREAQKGDYKKAPGAVIRTYGTELVGILLSMGQTAEATRWNMDLGFTQNRTTQPRSQRSSAPRQKPKTKVVTRGVRPNQAKSPAIKANSIVRGKKSPPASAKVSELQPATKAKPPNVAGNSSYRFLPPVRVEPKTGTILGNGLAPKQVSNENRRAHDNTLAPRQGKKASPRREAVQPIRLSNRQPNSLKGLATIRVTLNFRDVELADLVRLLASRANLNIVSQNPIEGRTTVNFDNIPVGTALDTVLRGNRYFYEVKDEIVWIFRQGEEPLETQVFVIRSVPAANIFKTLRKNLEQWDLIQGETGAGHEVSPGDKNFEGKRRASGASNIGTEQARSRRWAIQLEREANAVIVTATRPRLNMIGRFIGAFDNSIPSRGKPNMPTTKDQLPW